MTETPARPHARPRSPLSLRRATGRLFLAIALGALGFVIAPDNVAWWIRAVAGWDVAALTLVALLWAIILRADGQETRARAGGDDPGRATVFVIALASAIFSLFSAAVVFRRVKSLAEPQGLTWQILTLGAVALAWTLTHTAYTMRYARLHYRKTHDKTGIRGGLQFPGTEEPADIDFAYFAFTIGMCFQVSDVVVTSTRVRRAVLLHAVISFVYNTTILALALNLVFGLMT
jgi:uncharacterized membrane protein